MLPGKCGCPGNPATPFGGPASGLWPSGSAGAESAAAGLVSCRMANLIATCFTACVGATPCGFFPATPPGTIQFTANSVLLGNDGSGNSLGLLAAPHAATFDPLNATLQFKVIEFNQFPGNFVVIITDSTGFGVFQVQLFSDGTLFVVVGALQYNGTWTPVAGAEILVHYETIAGVPHLFLNNVEVSLTLFGPNANFISPNIILVGGESSVPNNKVTYDFLFVDTTSLPPTVNFCCPDGTPSR